MKDIDKEIEKAKLACKAMSERGKTETLSLIERMRPYVHLNNLLVLKMENLLDYDKH